MKEKIHETASHYGDMLSNVRYEILGRVQYLLEWLGGKVCNRYYHDEDIVDRNTFFAVNNDGYGVELYIETVETDENGNVTAHLVDTEDSYSYEWDLSDFNASNSLYLLDELEQIAMYIQDSGEKVVTEYE